MTWWSGWFPSSFVNWGLGHSHQTEGSHLQVTSRIGVGGIHWRACDLTAGHEWRQCGLRCVGLLSANSFVNRKFGSHGREEEVRPFCAPLWVDALQCLAFNLYICTLPILCLEQSSMRMKKKLPFLLCSSFVPSFWMVNPSTWNTTFSNGGRTWNFCY